MIGYIFRNAINILKRKPIMLWGVSLLKGVIVSIIGVFGSAVPIITIPITQTLNAGMAALYLDGYNGKEVNSKQLFRGFTKECCPRVTAGMLWYFLWNTIWGLVPIANVVKAYSYIFTPYILLTRPDISAMDALKLSMRQTEGYKLRMFGANILMGLILILLIVVFALMMFVPVLGWIVGGLGIIVSLILYPLFSGLVMAGFYQEAQSGRFKTTYPQYGYGNPYNANPYNGNPYNGNQYNDNQNNANPYNDNNAFDNRQSFGGNAENVNDNDAGSAYDTDNTAATQRNWYCMQCGVENSSEAMFCKNCGKQRNISNN